MAYFFEAEGGRGGVCDGLLRLLLLVLLPLPVARLDATRGDGSECGGEEEEEEEEDGEEEEAVVLFAATVLSLALVRSRAASVGASGSGDGDKSSICAASAEAVKPRSGAARALSDWRGRRLEGEEVDEDDDMRLDAA